MRVMFFVWELVKIVTYIVLSLFICSYIHLLANGVIFKPNARFRIFMSRYWSSKILPAILEWEFLLKFITFRIWQNDIIQVDRCVEVKVKRIRESGKEEIEALYFEFLDRKRKTRGISFSDGKYLSLPTQRL